jgi:hypothetical protein
MRRTLLASFVMLSACAHIDGTETSSDTKPVSGDRTTEADAIDASDDLAVTHPQPDGFRERPWRPDARRDQAGPRGTRYEREDAAPPPFEVISSWTMNDLTWCLGTHSADMSRFEQVRAIDRAAATWSRYDGITISRMAQCWDANIVINFYAPGEPEAVGTDFEHFSDDLPLASSGFPGTRWSQIEIQVNDDLEWTQEYVTEDDERYDIQTTLLHELGHSLGLDHSDVELAIMYPYYWGSRRQLTADDVHGVRSLYLSSDGPCADSESVASLALEAAQSSSEAAQDARDAFPDLSEALRADEILGLALEGMSDGHSAAADAHLADPAPAIDAIAFFNMSMNHLEQGRTFAHRMWLDTGSRDAVHAGDYATDAKRLAVAARRHATACAYGL